MSRRTVVAIVWAWIVLLTVTHFGARSPYSYGWAMFDHDSARISGAVVNPDALLIANVTRFFYDASPLNWGSQEAENLRLPLHSFTTAMLMSFTRSFLLANVLVNVLFAMLVALAAVNLAERYRIRREATLVALLTFFALPMYVEYLGQPLHYVAGISVSFLVVMSVVALVVAGDDARYAALAIAILSLNYDPYVYIAALVVLFGRRLKWSLLLAAMPVAVWAITLRVLSGNTMTTHLRKWFVLPVLSGWVDFFMAPLDRILLPFVATHVGLQVAFHQLIAMIYWPLLAVCVFLLVKLRPKLELRVVALLPLFFVLEQLAAAAFDWELNPRRAIPAVLAFAFAYLYAMDREWQRWRIAFIALFLMSGLLAMSDTLFGKPAIAYLHTGQAIRHDVHDIVRAERMRLDTDSLPRLTRDEPITWRDVDRAKAQNLGTFAVTQTMGVLLLFGLFWLTARAELLPRWLPWAAVAMWAVSLVRFVS
ncbi:MAG TPA: hypothetical protein VE974_17045 [Thermoanaerobaculia bacterium]|nr:hypothetical protein [Thermoanaerobaculia bacterium]